MKLLGEVGLFGNGLVRGNLGSRGFLNRGLLCGSFGGNFLCGLFGRSFLSGSLFDGLRLFLAAGALGQGSVSPKAGSRELVLDGGPDERLLSFGADEGDPFVETAFGNVEDVGAVEVDGPFGGQQEAAQKLEKGCLARPVGTKQGDTFTMPHVHRDVPQRTQLAVIDGESGQAEHQATPRISIGGAEAWGAVAAAPR